MDVKTRLFGDISVGDDKIIYFENGIIGFPELKHFALIHDVEKPDAVIVWLQSLDKGEFAMPVLAPNMLLEDYQPSVSEDEMDALGDFDFDDLTLLVTITVPEVIENMTINLKAPIIINNKNRYACQLVAENEEYLIRYPVYDLLKHGKAGGQ